MSLFFDCSTLIPKMENSKTGIQNHRASYTLYGPVTALAVDGVTFLAVGKSAHWRAPSVALARSSPGALVSPFAFSPLSLALETSPTTVVSSLVQQKSELAPRANLSVSQLDPRLVDFLSFRGSGQDFLSSPLIP